MILQKCNLSNITIRTVFLIGMLKLHTTCIPQECFWIKTQRIHEPSELNGLYDT